jgi:uncharacterized protein YbbK (DUF523 family)
MRLRVAISACLLGQEVRWDGGHKRDRAVAELLGALVEWVPVCPEVELGLGVPREPIRLEAGRAASPRLVAIESRRDLTQAMERFARRRVDELLAQGIVGYVLKSDSPSCGIARVPVHGARRAGAGVFARVLMQRAPRLPVAEERALHDAARRARFVERMVAYAGGRRRTLAHLQ